MEENMSDFKYFTIDDDMNTEYILVTSTEDIYYEYQNIYSLLTSKKGKKFTLIVDLILRNGFTFNRFIQLNFDGEQVISCILNPREVSERVKANTAKYLYQNRNLLEDSVLSQSAKNFVIKMGC